MARRSGSGACCWLLDGLLLGSGCVGPGGVRCCPLVEAAPQRLRESRVLAPRALLEELDLSSREPHRHQRRLRVVGRSATRRHGFCYTCGRRRGQEPLPGLEVSLYMEPLRSRRGVLLYMGRRRPRREVLLYRWQATRPPRAGRHRSAAPAPPATRSRSTSAGAAGCRTPRCSRTLGPCPRGWRRTSRRART